MICNICEKESVCKLKDGSDVVKCAEFLSINPNDYIKDAGIRFKVIDSRTGKEPTERVLNNIAKKGGLIIPDIDQFFVGEDGSLILADDCGNMTYCDITRFKIVKRR